MVLQPTAMDKLYLSSSAASPSPTFFLTPLSITKLTAATLSRPRTLTFNPRRPRRLAIVSCQDDSRNKLTEADLMEFKFGQMLGEDPKLTIAKIMGRKVDPEASYLEIEKNFYKNKGKMVEVKEVPFDLPKSRGSLSASSRSNLVRPGSSNANNELNLVRPERKPGIKVGGVDDSSLEERKPSRIKFSSEARKPSGIKVTSSGKSNVPNIILRKPSVYNEADDPTSESFKLTIKPNLSFKMRTDPVKEKFGGMTLLKKPEPINLDPNADGNPGNSGNDDSKLVSNVEEINAPKNVAGPSNVVYATMSDKMEGAILDSTDKLKINRAGQVQENSSDLLMLEKPKPFVDNDTKTSSGDSLSSPTLSTVEKNLEDILEPIVDDASSYQKQEKSETEMQPHKPTDVEPSISANEMSDLPETETLSIPPSIEVALKGKPQRLEQSVKLDSNRTGMDNLANHEPFMDAVEWMNFSQISTSKEHEDSDWERAEKLSKIGYRVEVELISCSTRGFAVQFGALIGFLPYRNMTDRFKFFAFPSWLRKKGLDPTKYRRSMGIVGNNELLSSSNPLMSSKSEIPQNSGVEIAADMEIDDLLKIYDQEKIRFLSSFVGQRIKVYVSLADKKFRRLTFSLKPKEKAEMVEKKRNLMARLSVGDVVKCSITKITFFGIFVEVEGVSALIHQSEVSWDSSVNPALDFKIGQILEAKVIELDYPLERISLSLKDITPDPMSEALECVVGDASSLTERFEPSQNDIEWAEVDSLIKELDSVDGVQSVSKGRFFLSPALAPTFQVYMASVFESQYKLLARAGNKGQEVIVEASLGKEEMKTAILTCTNRVG